MKKQKLQDTELGISNIYAFCQKNSARALGSRKESCWSYTSTPNNTPRKLISESIFPLKAATTLLSTSRKDVVTL